MGHPLRETQRAGLSYWLAYDESLNPHKFRVIKYETISSTYYTTEYGNVSTRVEGRHTIVNVTPKSRKTITVILTDDEAVTDQDLLSMLVYWTAKPLFLAVPAPDDKQEQTQQELVF